MGWDERLEVNNAFYKDFYLLAEYKGSGLKRACHDFTFIIFNTTITCNNDLFYASMNIKFYKKKIYFASFKIIILSLPSTISPK